jgi:DNA polymerase III epsilon subunit family exonuclease
MRSIVAIDLETTGLDPAQDSVIEIGAVRFRGPRIEAEWSTLVNPGRPLPPYITQLTGISDAMVAGARLARVLPELIEFVGDLPLLGHNLAFDLRFLERHTPFRQNQAMDTYDLASVILPAGRYRLATLAQSLGVVPRAVHRGLEDARTTQQIFVRLLERAADLPPQVLGGSELGANLDWGRVRPSRWLPVLAALPESARGRPNLDEEATGGIRRSNLRHAGAGLPTKLPISSSRKGEPVCNLAQERCADPHDAGGGGALSRSASAGGGNGHRKIDGLFIPAFLWAAATDGGGRVHQHHQSSRPSSARTSPPPTADRRRTAPPSWKAGNYLCPARLEAMRRLRVATTEMRAGHGHGLPACGGSANGSISAWAVRAR